MSTTSPPILPPGSSPDWWPCPRRPRSPPTRTGSPTSASSASLAALGQAMTRTGLAVGDEFDLDFHAVMHWGEDVALEKHYVPKRSQRTRSVLSFFAQDSSTDTLLYANADLTKHTQAHEVLVFAEHWRTLTGNWPGLLVMDQKV